MRDSRKTLNRYVFAIDEKTSHLRLAKWIKAIGKLKHTRYAVVLDGGLRYGAKLTNDWIRDLDVKRKSELQAIWSVGQVHMLNLCKLHFAKQRKRVGQIIYNHNDDIGSIVSSMFFRGIVPIITRSWGYSSMILSGEIADQIDADQLIFIAENPTSEESSMRKAAQDFGKTTVIGDGIGNSIEELIMGTSGIVIKPNQNQ